VGVALVNVGGPCECSGDSPFGPDTRVPDARGRPKRAQPSAQIGLRPPVRRPGRYAGQISTGADPISQSMHEQFGSLPDATAGARERLELESLLGDQGSGMTAPCVSGGSLPSMPSTDYSWTERRLSQNEAFGEFDTGSRSLDACLKDNYDAFALCYSFWVDQLWAGNVTDEQGQLQIEACRTTFIQGGFDCYNADGLV